MLGAIGRNHSTATTQERNQQHQAGQGSHGGGVGTDLRARHQYDDSPAMGRLTSAANARDPQLPDERLTVPWRSWGRDTMLSARPR